MRRYDFYYKQNVTEAELDNAYAACETADKDLVADDADATINHGIWGVNNGMLVTEQAVPDLTIKITDGVAYDDLGRRIPLSGGPTTRDLTASVPAVGGDKRYVRIFVEFTRALSDPRTDGLGAAIDYQQDESCTISQVDGVAAPAPAKPALVANKVCIATVLLTNGMGSITNSEISMDTMNSVLAPDRQGGGRMPKQRVLDTTEHRILFGPEMHADDVVQLGGKDLQADSGDIWSADRAAFTSGGRIFMQAGAIFNVEEIRAHGPPGTLAGGGYIGHVYCDQTPSDEFGDSIEITKWCSWETHHLMPINESGGVQVDPWLGLTGPAQNSWYLNKNGPAPYTGYEGHYLLYVNQAGAFNIQGLCCPLVGLPHGAKLTAVHFNINCLAVAANLVWGVGVYRKDPTTVLLINSGQVITPVAMPGTGLQRFSTDAIDTTLNRDIIDEENYTYYAVLCPQTTGALNGSSGIEVSGVRASYKIREASNVY